MKSKIWWLLLILVFPLLLLSGCSYVGNKSTSMSVIYIATSLLSLVTFAGYIFYVKKQEIWFMILFISVFIVNVGYFLLSVSDTLRGALWANRISYLGSVFLPLSMIMIIFEVTKLNYKRWVLILFTCISIAVFLIAASPGVLDIYYKSVALEQINGVSVLNKEYGAWHSIYLFYLMGYFSVMVISIIQSLIKKKVDSTAHAVILILSVFVNICVWLLEQLVRIDFEFLSVSYIITELFLISVYVMIQHQEKLIATLQENTKSSKATTSLVKNNSPEFIEHCEFFKEQLSRLTKAERAIYECYLAGKSTKEVLKEMSISENTLKFHNKNIYGKLGVSSRKQLLVYAKAINTLQETTD